MIGLRQLALATVFTGVAATAALGCGMASSWVDADYNAVFADSITRVETATLESDPSLVRISVAAEVPTGGYSLPTLEQVFYYIEPEDGIYEVYVMANPPAEMTDQTVSTLEMTIDLPANAAGYRIIAGNNCVTLMLEGSGLPAPEDGCAVQNLAV